jgi:hypothetical protein
MKLLSYVNRVCLVSLTADDVHVNTIRRSLFAMICLSQITNEFIHETMTCFLRSSTRQSILVMTHLHKHHNDESP